MKNLIMVSGTMGVGKTATCKELNKLLPKAVFLDGDWCWNMNPFIVSDETKSMVIKNICFLLNSFIECSEFENIIFCWVMDEQDIIDSILVNLHTDIADVKIFTLTADEASLRNRLMMDVNNGSRTYDVIKRSLNRIKKYNSIKSEKIDVSHISATDASKIIAAKLYAAPEL